MKLTPQQQTRTAGKPQANCVLAMAPENPRSGYQRAW